jgi:hypothetical protein
MVNIYFIRFIHDQVNSLTCRLQTKEPNKANVCWAFKNQVLVTGSLAANSATV